MKVGVHLGHSVPESGGQFAFQHSVGQALAQLAGNSSHTFVVFGHPNALIMPVKNIQTVPLQYTFAERLYSRLYRTAFWRMRMILDNVSPVYGDAKRIVGSGVDMMWYVGPFCSTMEIPYIYTLLDLQHLLQPYFPEVSANGVWKAREKHYAVALRRAARIVISTQVGKAEIEHFYQVPSERIVVLPYAAPQFDLSVVKDGDERVLAKYHIPKDYLFYPAQFWPQKNHVGLLHAVRLLRDRWNISLPVVFVGSDHGNLNYVQQMVAQLGLSTQVHFLGFVPRQDLISLYQNAFALTFPTLVGPDNLPSLEAFALGCPVVTSDLPGFEEQLGDAALLVNPTDEEQIALAIKSLYDDPSLRQTLVQRGLERSAGWTWQDYVRGVFAILDEFESIRRCWSNTEPHIQRPGTKDKPVKRGLGNVFR